MNDMEFIEALKTKRNACGYSQSRLAKELHISRQNLNEIENGKTRASKEMKHTLLHYLDYCKCTQPFTLNIDYLRVRFPTTDALEIIKNVLAMKAEYFIHEDYGLFGYEELYRYGEIIVTASKDASMGVLLELKGMGCRHLEHVLQARKTGWYHFLSRCMDYEGIFKRLDLAVNDMGGLLDIEILRERYYADKVWKRSRKYEGVDSGKLSGAKGVVCSKRLLNQAVGKSLRTHNLKPKKGAQVMRKNEKITALYERLSRDDFGKDDDQQRESNSISNQKAMLEEFAARQGFTNIVHFTDDGISGTCFDRPGFLAMMKEVEAGNVEYLCIKDMSRMGRDYLKVGQIMEILRQRGVRLIAINDGVDSARGDDDFTPFRNIMNEYYARDTSRKIRSTFQSKGKSGKHLTGTVIYGYLWNEARDQWLVDPEAAEVVKRIFAMTIDGYGPYQIASKLKSEKVLIPSAYLAQHGEGVNKNKTFKDVYGWGSSTICNILEKREYLGHTINFKTRKHFKDKKSHYVPEDEWTIFENTHEAIIDQQTFDLVQKIRGNVRRYPDGWGEAAPLTGLLYCADCGGKMYVHRTNNGKRISQYTCSQYSKVPVGKLCTTQHRINEDVVLSLISDMLKAIAEYAKHDRSEFIRVVQEAQSSQQTAEVRKQRTRLATAKQRVSELEVLLCKIYEDNILGKLSDSRYEMLDAQYAKEQGELTAEIFALEKAVKGYEKHEKDADRFIALIDKYENFDTLTVTMLNEFVEKILVHERDRKGSRDTTQEVEIYFNFVGRFVPPAFGEVELTPEELEEIRKKEERKDRLHQNYLKRKANGKQKEYEERTKAKKKAEIEARKAAIRTEDIAKGVFIPVSSLPQREPQKGAKTA